MGPQVCDLELQNAGIPWTTPGGNWFDKNGFAQGTTPYASVTFPASTVPNNKYYEFDVTQLVQEYISVRMRTLVSSSRQRPRAAITLPSTALNGQC
jgi:uncharacterized membrane protein